MKDEKTDWMPNINWYYREENVAIACGDCLDILKQIPDKSIDLVLTDPPYGISADKGIGGFGSSKTDKHYNDNWDKVPNKIYFDEMLRVGKRVIIFGGNYFTDKLPVNGHWICWDKKGNVAFKNPYSDCELAYTNIPKKVVKKYTLIQQGFITDSKDKRVHPTQKPTELFKMILKDYSKKDDIILDPFIGSGTTAVACKDLGRKCIGIEISEEYVKIAIKRLSQEVLKFDE